MKNKSIVIILCVIISFFAMRFCMSSSFFTVGTMSSCLLYPVLVIQKCVVMPVRFWLNDRATMHDLRQQCMTLQYERDKLFAQNIAYQAEHHYWRDIQELHNFNKRYKENVGHIAQILARHLSENNQFFLVDIGARQGIKKDMVALYNNCLIGRVTQVFPWYCQVCLITDAECKVAAFCSSTGATGIHQGVNDSKKTVLQYVSHLETVVVGDMIFSSGDGLIFPNGFCLGVIKNVEKGDLFYTIDIEPLLDFNAVQYCTLVAKSDVNDDSV
jgi:rod shape-determining protein MreC